jgi:hypothetical protein
MVELKEIVHPEFARRLELACDGNPKVPSKHFGRLQWFQDRFEEHGVHVAVETIRKWFAGDTKPRYKAMAALGQILETDELWLSAGKERDFSPEGRRRQNFVVAGGVINAIAGFIQMHGGHPAFPQDDDNDAKAKLINLYAVIRGAKYQFHVMPLVGEGDDAHWIVPHETRECIVLGVIQGPGLSLRCCELDWEGVDAVGKRKTNGFEVKPGDREWREITSFSDRI